jgi:hypothetical protein
LVRLEGAGVARVRRCQCWGVVGWEGLVCLSF